MELPKDPVMLLSVVNTKLRDYYTSLDEITVPTTVSGWLCLTGLQCSMM